MELFYVFNFRANPSIAKYKFPLTTDQIDYVDQVLRTETRNGLRCILVDFKKDGGLTNPAIAFCEILRKSLKRFSMYMDGKKINEYNLRKSMESGIVKFVVGRKVYNQLLL